MEIRVASSKSFLFVHIASSRSSPLCMHIFCMHVCGVLCCEGLCKMYVCTHNKAFLERRLPIWLVHRWSYSAWIIMYMYIYMLLVPVPYEGVYMSVYTEKGFSTLKGSQTSPSWSASESFCACACDMQYVFCMEEGRGVHHCAHRGSIPWKNANYLAHTCQNWSCVAMWSSPMHL